MDKDQKVDGVAEVKIKYKPLKKIELILGNL